MPGRYGAGTGMTGMGYGVAGQMSQIPPGGMDFSSPAAGAGMAAAGGLGAASELQTQQFSIPKGVSGAGRPERGGRAGEEGVRCRSAERDHHI